jgi:hypothetical protein
MYQLTVKSDHKSSTQKKRCRRRSLWFNIVDRVESQFRTRSTCQLSAAAASQSSMATASATQGDVICDEFIVIDAAEELHSTVELVSSQNMTASLVYSCYRHLPSLS